MSPWRSLRDSTRVFSIKFGRRLLGGLAATDVGEAGEGHGLRINSLGYLPVVRALIPRKETVEGVFGS
jgi:hypothetical protein